MSVDEMDKKKYEFIKEEIVQKKAKRFRRKLLRFLSLLGMAIVFGLVAAFTFAIAQPHIAKYFPEENENKTPFSFPTTYPDDEDDSSKPEEVPMHKPENIVEPTQEVADEDIEEEPIEDEAIVLGPKADIEDYLAVHDEIRTMAYRVNKSLITISSIVSGKDIFGNPTKKVIETSGLIIAQDEIDIYILVNYDRVRNAGSIQLKLSDTVSVNANLLSYDTDINLAVLTVKNEDIPSLYMNNNIAVAQLGESYTLTVGSPVVALGNPNGYPGSMDIGIITSRGSYASIVDNKIDLFNTNIPNNANGDGIIVNMKGEVIGIITRTLRQGLNENLSTVIGISKIKYIIEKLANNEPRTYFGIFAEDMSEIVKSEYGVSHGIYINSVQTMSPAFDAGIKGGDIITDIDDKMIINVTSFYNMISAANVGDVLKVKLVRTTGSTNKEIEVKVVLDKKSY